MATKCVLDTHHVVSNPEDGWDVKVGGAECASWRFDTKLHAIDYGRIGVSDSHGQAPNSPKG